MRDVSDKADNVGDTLKAEVFNINKNELQHVVETGGTGLGLDPEGGPDTDEYMLSKSIASYSGGGEYYECSGISPLYQLSRSTLKFTNNYFTGLQILFVATFVNTAAPQVQVGTLGVVDLKKPDGSNIPNGYIQIGHFVEAVYITDSFYMINYTPSLEPLSIPRMDFHYTLASTVDIATFSAGKTIWPLTQDGTTTITGASFNDTTHVMTLPHGYKYFVDFLANIDTGATFFKNIAFVGLNDATKTLLLQGVNRASTEDNHYTAIKGFLDLTPYSSPVDLGIFIRIGGVGAFGYKMSLSGYVEKYAYGYILQTGY
jgi:hypothetical protein